MAEIDYQKVRAKIVQEALSGDVTARQLYMKYWGRPFVADEHEEERRLRGLSDRQLAEELVRLIGPRETASIVVGLGG